MSQPSCAAMMANLKDVDAGEIRFPVRCTGDGNGYYVTVQFPKLSTLPALTREEARADAYALARRYLEAASQKLDREYPPVIETPTAEDLRK